MTLNGTVNKTGLLLLMAVVTAAFAWSQSVGADGMPRRYADFLPQDGWTWMNQISTVGSLILGLSMVPFFWNVWITRNAPKVEVDDPWGWGRSLEWATSCPPPRHNFAKLPRIRSPYPAFDAKHPELAHAEYEVDGEVIERYEAQALAEAEEQKEMAR